MIWFFRVHAWLVFGLAVAEPRQAHETHELLANP
jgi:hypothetical protein